MTNNEGGEEQNVNVTPAKEENVKTKQHDGDGIIPRLLIWARL